MSHPAMLSQRVQRLLCRATELRMLSLADVLVGIHSRSGSRVSTLICSMG